MKDDVGQGSSDGGIGADMVGDGKEGCRKKLSSPGHNSDQKAHDLADSANNSAIYTPPASPDPIVREGSNDAM